MIVTVDSGKRIRKRSNMGACMTKSCYSIVKAILGCFTFLCMSVAKYILFQICLLGSLVTVFILWILYSQRSHNVLEMAENMAPILESGAGEASLR